ncbi:molecular chaperone DnaJ [Mycoplasmatota bacterium WC44]
MSKRDYYDVLGVSKSADEREIKKAFRGLAKQYHPDVSDDPNAETKFKEVQEAYAVLSDTDKRNTYDQFGHEGMNFGQGGFNGFDGGFGGFEDIFSSFFGGGSRRRDPNAPRRGNDLTKRMTISFEEAAFGVKKKIKLRVNDECNVCHGSGAHSKSDISTCSHCNGSGVVYKQQQTIFGMSRTQVACSHCGGSGKYIKKKCSNCHGDGHIETVKTVEINIPEGINTGQQIRLSGKGEGGINGGPSGDLYIAIQVTEHELFERVGNDVVLELPITFSQAALGAEVKVPTVHGDVKLKIPSGTQSGTRFRLRGKGIKSVSSGHMGDQHVIVIVVTPEKLDSEQKKLFKKLSNTNEMSSSLWSKISKFLK